MKLRSILTGLIPTLSGALETGEYRDDLRIKATGWASQIGTEAMREGRDAADAIMALMALARAEGFEMQQLGLTASLGLCDDLLNRVAANTPPDFEPVAPERTVADILESISSMARQACNVYAIDQTSRRSMIATGEELAKAVARDIASGHRSATDADIAREIHEAVAEVATCAISRRDSEAERTLSAIARLAA